MNKTLRIVLLDLKLLLKTKVFYFKLVLFPCILILILGYMFGRTDSSKLSAFDVAFLSDDAGYYGSTQSLRLGTSLKNDVLKSKDVKSIINLKDADSFAQGQSLVKNKKASAFIYVPKDFTKAYVTDQKAEIKLISDNSRQIDKTIVKNILKRYNKNLDVLKLEQKELADRLTDDSKTNKVKLAAVIKKIQSSSNSESGIEKVSLGRNIKPLTTMQYESIAMIVMFSILTAFELAHSIVDDKLNNTVFRIKSTPTLDIQYALAKVMGIVLAIVVQMSVVMIISHFVFNIDFGNLFYILLTTVSYGFVIGSIVFCAACAAKDHMSISSFASLILYGFSFLGGSFIPKTNFPDGLKAVQSIIPNGKAINCYLSICQGGSLKDIASDLTALVLIGFVFLILSLKLYREGGHIKNAHLKDDQKSTEAVV